MAHSDKIVGGASPVRQVELMQELIVLLGWTRRVGMGVKLCYGKELRDTHKWEGEEASLIFLLPC